MSPEQVQGKRADVRSDIYSLGVTFYQMLTGINPYQSLTTEYEVYTKIVKEDLPPANQIYPGVSAYLVSILKFALEKDPDLRFQNCTEILKALEDKNTIFEGFNSKNEVPKIDKIILEENDGDKESVQTSGFQIKLEKKKSTAHVAGVSAIIFCWIPILNIVSLIMGIVAIRDANNELKEIEKNTREDGLKNKAKTAKELGWVSIFISIVVSIIVFVSIYYEYKDTDGDGIPDGIDNCIDVSGSSDNGCPLDGSCVFWIKKNENIQWDGSASIYVEDEFVGEIDDWFEENPGCDSENCVTIRRSPGTYKWLARWPNGEELKGEIEIIENECNEQGFNY
jgi:serine/threonine protein kinase